jgi:oxygen-dependent protoporphyrinogen oxidase
MRRVAVVGGGISGLAAAQRIVELDARAEVTLFEASGRLGGVLQTERRDGWLIECAADMFTTREPWAIDLCRRVGLADELIETDTRFRRAFVVRRGKLLPVPAGFTLMTPAKVWPVVTTPILSPLGKLRLAAEYFVQRRSDESDESLASFAVRRFGREAFERLIQPLIGGIYTADPSMLSMAATLPQFVEMERRWGSVDRGMRKKAEGGRMKDEGGGSSGARYGLFVAPRLGMQQLVEAVAAQLPAGCVRLNCRVTKLERVSNRWQVAVEGAEELEWFDDVILAAPGAVAERLIEGVDGELAALVGRIAYAGCCVVIVGVDRRQIRHPLDGFGFVVPAIEGRKIIAVSMASVKFAGRAPDRKVLLRVFVGGALQPELMKLDDGEMIRLVLEELGELIGLAGQPELTEVARWPGMMPQYHVGHLELVRQIEERAGRIPHFALAGNAYRGVGIPFCIRSGELAAERIAGATSRE